MKLGGLGCRIEARRGGRRLLRARVTAEEGADAYAQILDLVIICLDIIKYFAVATSETVGTLLLLKAHDPLLVFQDALLLAGASCWCRGTTNLW